MEWKRKRGGNLLDLHTFSDGDSAMGEAEQGSEHCTIHACLHLPVKKKLSHLISSSIIYNTW